MKPKYQNTENQDLILFNIIGTMTDKLFYINYEVR